MATHICRGIKALGIQLECSIAAIRYHRKKVSCGTCLVREGKKRFINNRLKFVYKFESIDMPLQVYKVRKASKLYLFLCRKSTCDICLEETANISV